MKFVPSPGLGQRHLVYFLFLSLGALHDMALAVNPFLVLHGSGADSCRLAPFIATHWDSVNNRDTIGFGDADNRYKDYPKGGYPWDDSKVPAYNNYNLEKTAATAVNIFRTGDDSTSNLLDTLRLAAGGDGIADAINLYALDFRRIIMRDTVKFDKRTYLDILNFGPYLAADHYLDTASNNVQILNNVYMYHPTNGVKGLATITLPPHWRKSKSYPIFLHGNGYGVTDNNLQYFGSSRSLLDAQLAAQFLRNSADSGIISVYVNNGGKESLGSNSALIANLERFFRITLPAYGGDTSRVITIGGSRGGFEAANWGASTAFTTQTILSTVPPIKTGSTASLSLSTFPGLFALTLPLGSPDAWKRDYASSGSPTGVLGPIRKAQAARKVLFGDSSLAAADNASLFGIYQNVDSAKMDGKFLHFSYGSHDSFFPLAYFLQFDSMLTARHIRHSSHIGYNFGHNVGIWPEYWGSEMGRIAQAQPMGPYTGKTRKFQLLKELAPNTDPIGDMSNSIIIDTHWIDTICKYRPNYLAGGSGHSPDSLGFSATIPYRIIQDSTFEIAVSGESKKPWKIWARYENGYNEVFSAWGGFGDSVKTSQDGANTAIIKESGREFAIIRNLKLSLPDTLEWFFKFDGHEVPNRFTPFVDPVRGEFQRALSVASAAEAASAVQYQRGFSRPTLGNGVDQFHTLLLKANDTAEFASIPDMTIHVPSQSLVVFQVADHIVPGSDSDTNDSLRYDLLDSAGHYISGGMMDRRTGEFRLYTAGLVPNTYPMKALVSDGKGGTDSAFFHVTVISP